MKPFSESDVKCGWVNPDIVTQRSEELSAKDACKYCGEQHEEVAYGKPSVRCINKLKERNRLLFELWDTEVKLRKQDARR